MVRDERHGGYGDTSGLPSLAPEPERGAAAVAALTAVLEVQRESARRPIDPTSRADRPRRRQSDGRRAAAAPRAEPHRRDVADPHAAWPSRRMRRRGRRIAPSRRSRARRPSPRHPHPPSPIAPHRSRSPSPISPRSTWPSSGSPTGWASAKPTPTTKWGRPREGRTHPVRGVTGLRRNASMVDLGRARDVRLAHVRRRGDPHADADRHDAGLLGRPRPGRDLHVHRRSRRRATCTDGVATQEQLAEVQAEARRRGARAAHPRRASSRTARGVPERHRPARRGLRERHHARSAQRDVLDQPRRPDAVRRDHRGVHAACRASRRCKDQLQYLEPLFSALTVATYIAVGIAALMLDRRRAAHRDDDPPLGLCAKA